MNATQLALISEITTLYSRAEIEHWLRGGRAVDFAVGRIARRALRSWRCDTHRLPGLAFRR